jgi:uncharacterized protein YndB with AHSA1/START domain
MIDVTVTTEIAAPPETVWRMLIDLPREPAWMRAVEEVAFVAPASTYAPGARMRRAGRFLGIRLAWESEITEFVPNSRIVFRHSGAISGHSRWEVEPTAQGSLVRLTSIGPAPGVLGWLPALARAGVRAGLAGDLKRLKRLVEAR